jgi:GTPase
MADLTGPQRTGSVALIGRPNAGKSTLMNRLLDYKLAIVSDKPQTTRHRLVGLLTEGRGQMIFLDTPGVHRPLHDLNRQMVRYAVEAMNQADIVCLLVDASIPFGRGDAYMLDLLRKVSAPRFLVLNKIDTMGKPKLLPLMERYGREGLFAEIVPVSAASGDGCAELLEVLWPHLPAGPPIYDPEWVTTQPERYHVAERIREQVLLQTRDELPFATAVIIDRWQEEEGRLVVFASILVESPGQKKILIGTGGERVREIGTRARQAIQDFLGRKLHLELHIRLEPRWREDLRLLARMEREVEGDLGAG